MTALFPSSSGHASFAPEVDSKAAASTSTFRAGYAENAPGRASVQLLQAAISTSQPRKSTVRSSLGGQSADRDGDPTWLRMLGTDPTFRYANLLADARSCLGSGNSAGAFPEEWDAQLLVDAGVASTGERVIIFTPAFLKDVLDDEQELDTVFKYIVYTMDEIAMNHDFIFVYCHAGADWSKRAVAERLRIAYDILPKYYSKHLRKLYVLHSTFSFRLSLRTLWAWMSTPLWSKLEFVDSIDLVCKELQPDDPAARSTLRRRFPQLVQREDASWIGQPQPVAFGVPLEQLCGSFGVDHLDRSTGRRYQKLPPALVFLCEALERSGGAVAEESFFGIFNTPSAAVYNLVKALDYGHPLDPECPQSALWCALKLYMDCLPEPLLSFRAFEELSERKIAVRDKEAQHKLLTELLHNLPLDSAYAALYTASFLWLMCKSAMDHHSGDGPSLTPKVVAQAFTPCFVRPKNLSEEDIRLQLVANAFVETFIGNAEDEQLWVGVETETAKAGHSSDEEVSGSEGGGSDEHTF